MYINKLVSENKTLLMGIAAICIMFYHQNWYTSGVWGFFKHTGDCGVEIFLFLSGWGIYQSLQKNSISRYFYNRFSRLFPSCVFIGCSQVILQLIGFQAGVNTLVGKIMMCLGFFKWFVFAITVYYALSPLIVRLFDTNVKLVILGVASILLNAYLMSISFLDDASSVFFTTLPVIIYRFPAFLFGMVFSRNNWKITPLIRVIGIISFLLSILMAYDLLGYYSRFKFTMFVFSVPLIIEVTSYIAKHMEGLITFFIALAGSCSLELYLWHDFLFHAFTNFSICVFSQIMLSTLLSFLFALLTRRITTSFNNIINNCLIWSPK